MPALGPFLLCAGTHEIATARSLSITTASLRFRHDPETLSRFVSEARAVNAIRHPNLVDIFSFGELEDGRQYYVMELLNGETLDTYLKRLGGRIEPGQLLAFVRPLGRALDAAHAAGVIHRDLKPSNIFLTADIEGHIVPKLLDFGVAKLSGDEHSKEYKTGTGHVLGTPSYMSPEQCKGPDIDHRSDIYAFGCVVFRAGRTGRRRLAGPWRRQTKERRVAPHSPRRGRRSGFGGSSAPGAEWSTASQAPTRRRRRPPCAATGSRRSWIGTASLEPPWPRSWQGPGGGWRWSESHPPLGFAGSKPSGMERRPQTAESASSPRNPSLSRTRSRCIRRIDCRAAEWRFVLSRPSDWAVIPGSPRDFARRAPWSTQASSPHGCTTPRGPSRHVLPLPRHADPRQPMLTGGSDPRKSLILAGPDRG